MSDPNSPSSRSDASAWVGSLVGPVFLALAAWFVWGPTRSGLPHSEAVSVRPDQFSTEPPRSVMADPPTAFIGGFDQSCMDCHRFFQSTVPTDRQRTQHTHIVLDHGLNNRCLNCHHDGDRSKLVLHDGTPIPFAEVEHLCAKCHGPTYRDWQQGMHGKTLGYWSPSLGPQRRLKCTHCHDPHSPAFKPVAPLPGPHTLRMGRRHHGVPDKQGTEHNPLRVWDRRHQPAPAPTTGTQGSPHR